MTVKRMKMAWKYRKYLWKYREVIRRRRQIKWAAAGAAAVAAAGIFAMRDRIQWMHGERRGQQPAGSTS
jgi:hypothetical protein